MASKVSLHNQRGNRSAFTLRQQFGSLRACGSKQGARNSSGSGNDDVINSNRSNTTRTSDIDYPFVADLTDSRGTGICMNGEPLSQCLRQRHQAVSPGGRGGGARTRALRMMAKPWPPSGSIAFESSGDDGVALPDRPFQSGGSDCQRECVEVSGVNTP